MFFLGFGYKITDKPRIPYDNLVHASSIQFRSEYINIKRDFYSKIYTPFLIGFNLQMDHMRISVTKP